MLTTPLRCALLIVIGSIALNLSTSAVMDDAEFERLDSSVLSGVKYDAVSQTMSLRFTNGTVNDYLNVPAKIYESLKAHHLKGGYYRGFIEGRFETVPVYDPAAEAEAAEAAAKLAAAAPDAAPEATAEPEPEPTPAEPAPAPEVVEPVANPTSAEPLATLNEAVPLLDGDAAPATANLDQEVGELFHESEDTVEEAEVVVDSPVESAEEQVDELSDEEVFNLIDEMEEDAAGSLDAIDDLDALVK